MATKKKKIIKKPKKVLAKSKKKLLVVKKKIKKPAKKIAKKKTIQKKKKIIKKAKPQKKVVRKAKPKAKKKKIVKKAKKLVVHRTPASAKASARRAKEKKPEKQESVEAFPAESLFKAKIKVVGVGGGGGSIVSEIGKSLQKATFVVADTDIRSIKKKNGIKYFLFGQEMTHGLGTGLNIDLAKKSAESARAKISGIFKDQDIVIFIASLGGGLGSGATQVFAEVAKEFGGITLGIFTLPFKFEGANKHRIALNALKTLRQSLNVSLVIPNEKIFKVINTDTAITEAFSMVNKSLVESLESLIDLIYSPGIINIDFADLRAILKGIGNSAFLNTVEESGKDRAEKICERILINPLLQNSTFEAEKILLNIAGAANLSMLEVEKISRRVSELNPKAKIIFGISKNQKLKNKIKVTILMTGGGAKATEKVYKEEKIEQVKPIGFSAKEKSEEAVASAKISADRRKKKEVTKIKTKKKKFIAKTPEKKKEKIEVLPVLPVFTPTQTAIQQANIMEERKLRIIEQEVVPMKTAIRRSGLEIKKAEEQEEKRRQEQEKEWEIPAFLRKVR